MTIDKAIASGKERRRKYRRSKVFAPSCRNHGGCPYCEGNRRHRDRRLKAAARDALTDV